MITACRTIVYIFLTVIALGGHPAAAGRVDDDGPDRILIANPAPALRTYLLGNGFTIEAAEELEALDLSLMIARPPRPGSAAGAVGALRSAFPDAVVALDDPFHLAQDTRARTDKSTAPQDILSSVRWPSNEHDGWSGLRVGVIDSSLDAAHPALKDAHIIRRSFTSGKAPARDTIHGTVIAVMLVGESNDQVLSGLLGDATLFHAGIFQDSRQGPKASSADFLRAMDWLLKSGVKVINASITSPSKNPVVLYAMSMLSHQKAIVIAAGGNRGPSGPPVYPAAIESAFAVTAVSVQGEAYRHANAGDYIDISAPGIDLPTTSRKMRSGTSLAVPFVTAAVARLTQACGLSPKEAQARLQDSARDLGPRGWDSRFGWGLLQVAHCAPTATQVSAAPRNRRPSID